MTDPIIFLDIDGVLNAFGDKSGPLASIYPQCVSALNHIWLSTGFPGIVLSSSWRHIIIERHMTLLGFSVFLKSHGIAAKLIGHTPDDDEYDTRGEQIQQWRRRNKHTGRYVVLDDMDDGIRERGLRAVFTNGATGLTMEDAGRAVAILNCGV